MPITTIHNYIDNYPISPNSRRLIIGTIHPHLIQNFNIDFFYGNIGSFWDILSNAFPQRQFGNRDEIIQTLNNFKVAITDIIRQCDRENENVTADSKLYNIIFNAQQIQAGIENSQVDTIYFTSRFGKNNAARIFVNTFNIPNNFNQMTSEFTIPQNYFGRQIRCVVLYSPSNNANRGIARAATYLNNIRNYQQFEHPVKQFKIEFYQNKFDFFNNDN
ncbi:hypothetical protein [Flavobacterium sp. N1994]|uniref:hypothetical protein n=1 Tax=Flavobacterium sp. N1994 TaxID=2986827 RepID=UPI0022233B22|nr:hypothetical protein [Flavobacterium sp. N1994]